MIVPEFCKVFSRFRLDETNGTLIVVDLDIVRLEYEFDFEFSTGGWEFPTTLYDATEKSLRFNIF